MLNAVQIANYLVEYSDYPNKTSELVDCICVTHNLDTTDQAIELVRNRLGLSMNALANKQNTLELAIADTPKELIPQSIKMLASKLHSQMGRLNDLYNQFCEKYPLPEVKPLERIPSVRGAINILAQIKRDNSLLCPAHAGGSFISEYTPRNSHCPLCRTID